MTRCDDNCSDFYFSKRRLGFEIDCVRFAYLCTLAAFHTMLTIYREPIRDGLWERLVDSFSFLCIGVPPVRYFDWTNNRTLSTACTSIVHALWFDFNIDFKVTSSSANVQFQRQSGVRYFDFRKH